MCSVCVLFCYVVSRCCVCVSLFFGCCCWLYVVFVVVVFVSGFVIDIMGLCVCHNCVLSSVGFDVLVCFVVRCYVACCVVVCLCCFVVVFVCVLYVSCPLLCGVVGVCVLFAWSLLFVVVSSLLAYVIV